MSNNVAGMWRWSPTASGRVEIACLRKSRDWMRRPSSGADRNCPVPWRSDQSSGCGCQEPVGPAPKKRPGVRSHPGRVGSARNGGGSDERAEVGAQQSATSLRALEGRGSSGQSPYRGSFVTQARLLPAGECEKARGEQHPPGSRGAV